jgi:hypothetical protein
MPVRDVALDEAEKQLEESGRALTIMVLPQGGLRSEFGKFNADAYAKEVVSRLTQTKYMKTDRAPESLFKGVTLAGHSGGGATFSGMAKASVAQMQAGEAPTALTGDLVLFDAINSFATDSLTQFNNFKDYAEERLKADLKALKALKTVAERIKYLKTAPKLLGYWSTGGGYEVAYTNLQHAINQWFIGNASELEPLGVGGCLHANYSVYNKVEGKHEELMRGHKAGKDRKKGEGTILKALTAAQPTYTACPTLGDLTEPKAMKWPEPKPKVEKKAVEEEKKPAAVGH